MHLEYEAVFCCSHTNTATEELELVAIVESTTRTEHLAVDPEAGIAPDRLHKRFAIEQVDKRDRAAAGTGQAQFGFDARTETQGQMRGLDAALTLDIANQHVVKFQMTSSQRTTMGSLSSSGPTRNSTRTSR